MCTALTYRDATDSVYLGRTLELDVEEPYLVTFVPKGQPFRSGAEGHADFEYTTEQDFLAVTSPSRFPTDAEPLTQDDLKVTEGLNDAGLTFSLLAYPTSGGGDSSAEVTRSLIQATDLGSWILGCFSSVAQVKAALGEQPVFLTRLAMVGDLPFPFHIVVNDKSGGSIVIEWHRGELSVLDNPVGVMTNGPDFQWHLTNLGNWTHLTNVDQSTAKFGSLEARQPDSGISTASLPRSDTSVDRFVRAVFYANFTEKTQESDESLLALARIMNNFDRPRGVSVSSPDGGEGMSFQGVGGNSGPPTEYTSWTNLSDLDRGRFLIRTYGAFNYTSFDLGRLAEAGGLQVMPLSTLASMGGDGTDALASTAIS